MNERMSTLFSTRAVKYDNGTCSRCNELIRIRATPPDIVLMYSRKQKNKLIEKDIMLTVSTCHNCNYQCPDCNLYHLVSRCDQCMVSYRLIVNDPMRYCSNKINTADQPTICNKQYIKYIIGLCSVINCINPMIHMGDIIIPTGVSLINADLQIQICRQCFIYIYKVVSDMTSNDISLMIMMYCFQ